MRLPQHLLDSPYFLFSSITEFKKSLVDAVDASEHEEIISLDSLGLPPVSSRIALASMFGISPGLIWSYFAQTHRHYRSFKIPKGKSSRQIDAPRVGLKIIQKWFSVQIQRHYNTPDHVYGFVPNRSHIDAANRHCGAKWVFSVDVTNFFQTTPQALVIDSLQKLGFREKGASLLGALCCLRGNLAQGAPSSPVLSNICFSLMDEKLAVIAKTNAARLTRYADDIVFSGVNDFPESLPETVINLFENTHWALSKKKTHLSKLPNRLKVHGLLVHGDDIRLTKGYRNKLRAYEHLLLTEKIAPEDLAKVNGHLIYGKYIHMKARDPKAQ